MRKYIFILFALTTALSSCVSYDAEEFTGKTLPRVTGYTTGITNDWLYINLRTGKYSTLTSPMATLKRANSGNVPTGTLPFAATVCERIAEHRVMEKAEPPT